LLLTLLAVLAQDHKLTLADPRLAAVFTNYKIGHAPVAMAFTLVVTLGHLDLSLLVMLPCKNEPPPGLKSGDRQHDVLHALADIVSGSASLSVS